MKLSKNGPFVIFLLLTLAILAVVYKGYKEGKFEFTKSTEKNAPSEIKTINLPVALNSHNVTTVYLAYNFFGPIKEIRSTDKGKQIILDTVPKTLPDFIIIDKETKISRVEPNNEITPADTNALKVGLRISISTTYDLKSNLWMTRNVFIVGE